MGMFCNGFYGMSGFGMFGGGLWGLIMMMVQFVIFALVIFLIYRVGKGLLSKTSLFSDSYMESLKERYVRGQISEDEYIKIKKVLIEK
jgi:putative membrane protein